MIIMQLGIAHDYWLYFTEKAWSVHIHYWTGTIWYIYLIIQPYFITTRQLERHRTNGIIGMFLAGGVSITAFSMLHRDMVNAENAMKFIDEFGPFQAWFFYGVAAVEIVMIIAFAYAVIKSIIHRKNMEDHAWWLITTVFIIMMPALARGMHNLQVAIYHDEWPHLQIMIPVYISEAIIISMILAGAWYYKKMQHPATVLAITVNLFNCLLEPLGRSTHVQEFLKTILKG